MRYLLAVVLLILTPALAHGQAATKVGSGIQVVPRTSSPGKDAANGAFWINSTDSNRPYFTNPGGTMASLLTSIFVDPPLVGTGTAASHLTCPTCVLTSASYADPAWVTSLAGSKITGPISYAGTPGTFSLGLFDNGANTNVFQRYIPAQAGNSIWNCGFSVFDNPVGARKNNSWLCGWNLAMGGGQIDPLYGAGGFVFEQFWNQAGSPTQEHYFLWTPPDGTGQHRYMFFIGRETAPFNSYLNFSADQIDFSAGKDLNTVKSLVLNTGSSTIRSPSTFPRLIAEDTSNTIGIYNGVVATPTRGQVSIDNTGQITIRSTAAETRIGSPTQDQSIVVGAGGPLLKSNDSSTGIAVVDGVLFFNAAGNFYSMIMSGTVANWNVLLQPLTDKNPLLTLGKPGNRWGYGATALSSADWTALTCSASEEGTYTTVVKGALQASCFTVCLKKSDDTYAKVELGCAP